MEQYIPKYLNQGKQLNMRIGQKGELYITFDILNEEKNLSEKVEFLIDTGFNGYLQLPSLTIDKLNLKLINKSKSRGFDGVEKEVGITTTKIKILDQTISDFPIQVISNGVPLIGTNLLKNTHKMVIIDYRNNIFTITDEPKVQKKVHKTVIKYAR